MTPSTVALVRCASYGQDTVDTALRRGLDLLGGVGRFALEGERLLLKPNLLVAAPPERAITTHPAVFAACARILIEAGAALAYGDSPGRASTHQAVATCGLAAEAERLGIALADFRTSRPWPSALPGRDDLPLAAALHDCDGVISLPKAKTHQLTRLTGAVKNTYGLIPGARKALYHVQNPDVRAFARLLAEISLSVRPRLHILDAVMAMEGNGPRSGTPRPLRALILSDDPVAVDAVFARLVDMEPTIVPTAAAGAEMGLGVHAAEDILLVGDDVDALRDPAFGVIRQPVSANTSLAHFAFVKNLLLPRPVIDAELCVRCGVCVEACPVPDKAVRFAQSDAPPEYDYRACIRCYCCQEMCPQGAIYRRTPPLGRLVGYS